MYNTSIQRTFVFFYYIHVPGIGLFGRQFSWNGKQRKIKWEIRTKEKKSNLSEMKKKRNFKKDVKKNEQS